MEQTDKKPAPPAPKAVINTAFFQLSFNTDITNAVNWTVEYDSDGMCSGRNFTPNADGFWNMGYGAYSNGEANATVYLTDTVGNIAPLRSDGIPISQTFANAGIVQVYAGHTYTLTASPGFIAGNLNQSNKFWGTRLTGN